MRGSDERTGELFSYVDLEKRVPAKHPLRLVRVVVNEVLSRLDGDFAKAYSYCIIKSSVASVLPFVLSSKGIAAES